MGWFRDTVPRSGTSNSALGEERVIRSQRHSPANGLARDRGTHLVTADASEVAQVSQPAVSQACEPADHWNLLVPGKFCAAADWEIRDTAGWETCATRSEPANPVGLVRMAILRSPDKTSSIPALNWYRAR